MGKPSEGELKPSLEAFIVARFLKPMNYLVTGGAGFLGSHLIGALHGDITVVDDLSIAKYYSFPPSVKLVKGRIEEVEVQGKFDYVVHLAARPSPED